ncbi:3-oxoacyl-[acyl-carrier protein] reductase/ketoreductase [Pelagirhabdus alkalitolerans]|uniref:3-oxoacyl-[acyl-carrier protein] reductase/ketoreductase n=1 Tax=Pelagirhabdus alkalitolerans TaxID=1612202 RepID=A0A1G6IJH0_9BACI|nr:SDR family oxidoreductase [Pelagirhabdus alkalitolerans]SDC06638.1 3-oxoacyl-[acyl-carrier protein] reductase/ketoreductase [Pelagirhabdus alkalitolerans]
MSVFSNEALANHHVLITGATGEIGSETAKVLASMGAKVTITGRNESKLRSLQKELETVTSNHSIYTHIADITKQLDREQLIADAESTLGSITDLVNNAGITGGGQVDELDPKEAEMIMDVNYFSALRLTQPIYQKMIEQGAGNIVNVASLSGLRGTAGNTAYAASKFAMIGWTQSMAYEAIKHRIRVNAVCPGFVDTSMAAQILEKQAKQQGKSYETLIEETKKKIPSGRLTTTLEVANTIGYLLTDACDNIVGESVKISGGTLMR